MQTMLGWPPLLQPQAAPAHPLAAPLCARVPRQPLHVGPAYHPLVLLLLLQLLSVPAQQQLQPGLLMLVGRQLVLEVA